MKLTPKYFKCVIFFSSILAILLIARCEDEKSVAREYPRLTGTIVTNITDSGATVTSDLSSLGTASTLEYGFLWGFGEEFYYTASDKIVLGRPKKTGIFSAEIRSALIKDRKYGVVPFVKTVERIVYGPVATFNSLGSQTPVVYGFYPDSAAWGDTVKISGRNFSYVKEANKVSLNQINCQVWRSTDSTLLFVIDPLVVSQKNVISIELAGNVVKFTKDTLKLNLPKILNLNPSHARWGDTISLRGIHLKWFSKKLGDNIKLGTFNCLRIGEVTDSLIRIRVPYEIATVTNNISMFVNNMTKVCDQPFTLLPPYFSISPTVGTWGTIVILKGKFNTISSRNKIYFNNALATISSTTSESMVIKVPNSLSDRKAAIRYDVTPFQISSADSFSIAIPFISGVTPKYGTWDNIITLSGYFSPVLSMNKVYFNSVEATILSADTNLLTVKVPLNLSDINSIIKHNINSFSCEAHDTFRLSYPRIDSMSPKEGAWQDQITLTGIFNPSTSLNKVYFNNVAATVISATSNVLKVGVPPSLPDLKSTITNKINSLVALGSDTFNLYHPLIKTFSPVSGPTGTNVTIRGKYFGKSNSLSVKFGDYFCSTFSNPNDSTIISKVPSGATGSNKITIIQALTTSSSEDFNVVNPVINNIYPFSGTFNDEVTIEGANFIFQGTNASVKFGTIGATLKSISNDKIVVFVPQTIDSIPRKIIVTLLSSTISSTQNFILSPPEISNVQPNPFFQDDIISITGSGFCPVSVLNSVSIGSFNFSVSRSTGNEITLSPPLSLPGGFYSGLTIKVGNYKRTYPLNINFKNFWNRLELPDTFQWKTENSWNSMGLGFTIKNLGYMMDFTDARLTSYNPVTGEFIDLGTFTEFQHQNGQAVEIIRDTAYLLVQGQGLFRYDINLNSFIIVHDYVPTFTGHLFSLNEKLFYGFPSSSDINLRRRLWTFDFNKKEWKEVSRCPQFSDYEVNKVFTISDKLYALFRDNVFCQYDPLTNIWTKLASFPGTGITRLASVSFVINGLGYIGLGRPQSTVTQSYNDLWVYNPESNLWTPSVNFPTVGRHNSISFVINNKAYVGFGYETTIPRIDFYEFDPNHIMK